MNKVFDEEAFNQDFDKDYLKERERLMEEKRRLFEETETQEFKQYKEQLHRRLHENKSKPQAPYIEVLDDDHPSTIESNPEPELELEPEPEPKPSIDAGILDPSKAPEEEEKILTEEELAFALEQANQHKLKGNELFSRALWEGAISEYTKALTAAPKSHVSRSIFFANRAACFLNLNQFEDVVKDCTSSLALDPNYTKSILRRAQAYERLDKPSEALEDYKRVLELQPNLAVAKEAVERLPAEIQEKLKRDTAEILGKAKELGNSFLGLFGLSLDNFKLQQDPGTGSYSVNFQGTS